jgi:hypothetical protein
MNTNTNTNQNNTGTIVAVDLGKYKSVACAYTGDRATAQFSSFATVRDHLRRLFAKY